MSTIDVDLEDDTDPKPVVTAKDPSPPEPVEVDLEVQDEGEGQTETTGDPDASTNEEAQPQKASRAEARFQKLVTKVKEAEELAAKAREEAAAERARREMLERFQESQRPKVDPREEEARLAEMDPADRSAYLLQKTERDLNFKIELLKFESADKADLSDFKAKAVVDPRYAKYADQVEAELAKMRKTGQNVPREMLLQFLIGQAVLKNQPKAKAQAADAKKNLELQRAAPSATKGDQAGGAKLSEREARLKRLANVTV